MSEPTFESYVELQARNCELSDEIAKLKQDINYQIGEYNRAVRAGAQLQAEIDRLQKLLNSNDDSYLELLNDKDAKIEQLKKALFEWMIHHWGLEKDDEVANASHSAKYCWDVGLKALDAKSDDELRTKCLLHLKYISIQTPKT